MSIIKFHINQAHPIHKIKKKKNEPDEFYFYECNMPDKNEFFSNYFFYVTLFDCYSCHS